MIRQLVNSLQFSSGDQVYDNVIRPEMIDRVERMNVLNDHRVKVAELISEFVIAN